MKILVLVGLFLVTSCGSLLTPKADVKKVGIIDAKAKKIAFRKVKKIGSTKKMLVSLKRGQWVASLNTDKKSGEKSLMIRKVVRVKKASVTIETETYSSNQNPKLRSVLQQVLGGYPRSFAVNGKVNFATLFSNLEVRSMKIKNGDEEVQDMSQHSSSPLMKMGISGFTGKIKMGKATKKSCATPYISSSACYYVPYSMGMMGMSFKGSYIQNSRIPIVGYLSTDSEYATEVVIAFGFKGRKIFIK